MNDVEGNPIEIAAVIVFKVIDSAKAVLMLISMSNLWKFKVKQPSVMSLQKYPYDTYDNVELTLRGNAEEVSNELAKELQDRLNVAGVQVIEARLTHLAYSTEKCSSNAPTPTSVSHYLRTSEDC